MRRHGQNRGGSLYLSVIAVSYLLTGISQMYLCILKNSGRAAKSSMISATSVVVNIFINAVLIYGLFGMPRMEIVGAVLRLYFHVVYYGPVGPYRCVCAETSGARSLLYHQSG